MVSWIYGLQSSGLIRVFEGFVGRIPVPTEDVEKSGHYRLDVNYTDRGAGVVPALNASSSVRLRPRLAEAESADEINGPQVLGSGKASGQKFVGAINHGHSLRFENVNFSQANSATLKIASAGAGGRIELRIDSAEGRLLGAADVEVNGSWEEFYERSVVFDHATSITSDSEETSTPVTGRHDLIILFTHPNKASGLMNLDSIKFEQRQQASAPAPTTSE